MASKSCVSCLRTLQLQTRSLLQTRSSAPRGFATARRLNAAPVATRDMPIPPVDPIRAEGETKASKATPRFVPKKNAKVFNTYTAYGMTEVLYKECSIQADYDIPQARDEDAEMPKTDDGEDLGVGGGWWHDELGLKPTFSTWTQVTMLHMYLLSARLRNLSEADPQPWQQHLLDHFFYDAENRMAVNHNIHARGTRNKYLKDLFVQWRGLLAAYDEGISKGDAVLAAAVWRNVFRGDENVDITKLAQIVSYIRRTLKGLDEVSDTDLMQKVVSFGSPTTEANVVRLRSPMFDLPFEKGLGKDQPVVKKGNK